MILSLYANEQKIKLPDIVLDENKNYEIAVTSLSAIVETEQNEFSLVELVYNGVKAMPGPNPYTLIMALAGNKGFRISSGYKVLFFPLRTNELGATYFEVKVKTGQIKFSDIFLQILIRESNGKDQ